ncbi:MAG TPA: hypothetical protein VHC22_08430 [Pirellulales bacterium]|nr:hypothetical protein [Pirellulales bacterium]
MNATNVIGIIHWVGVAFVFLWFLGGCMKDGLWNNAIRCMNAYIAAFGTLLTGLLLFSIAVAAGVSPEAPSPEDPYTMPAVLLGSFWLCFLISLAIIQTITDRLSTVKVAFHPVMNMIGSFFCVCGIAFLLMCFSMPVYTMVLAVK